MLKNAFLCLSRSIVSIYSSRLASTIDTIPLNYRRSLNIVRSEMIRFDGKVALITGAGGGLGREYAIAFAERGASVIVNDLGSSSMGQGQTNESANKVVQEIISKGGKAIANYDSVENGAKIIQFAIDNFGHIDIVVNNAGILRDKSFKNMTEDDWDSVFRVHVKGAYSVTKAAWDHMCSQNYGRIIMTSSNSAIYGNFGQANYSAAKSALIGFSNALSKEGVKRNVFCNVVVPTAASRLTKNLMPDDINRQLDPKHICPLVVWLCHDSCPENGGIFEAQAGFFAKIACLRSHGKALLTTPEGFVTPESVRDNWPQIVNMSRTMNFETLSAELVDSLEKVKQNFSAGRMEDSSSRRNEAKVIKDNNVIQPTQVEYDSQDAILYALSIGANVANHLPLLFESHQSFAIFPLFAVTLCPSMLKTVLEFKIPKVELDLSKLLHGEQYFEFKKPFLAHDKITSYCNVADVMDKGNACVMLLNVEIKDANGGLIAFGQYSLFVKNAGGFGGRRTSDKEIRGVTVPLDKKPDFVVEERTSPDQAALYRIASGDLNPIHIDPDFAEVAGLKSPILHGLCTLGFSTRHLIEKFSPQSYTSLKAIKVRFSNPVVPGQTLVTEMWRAPNNRVHFRTKVKESGQIVLSDAYADFYALNESPEIIKTLGNKNTELKCAPIFDMLKSKLAADSTIAQQIKAIYLWIINKDGKESAKYTMDFKHALGSIYEGASDDVKPDAILTISDEDMVDLVVGSLNPMKAFMSGRLKIKGNIMLTQKLQRLFQEKAKL